MDGSAAGHGIGRCGRSVRLALPAQHNIDLSARKSWCESNDPQFAAKAADVVGLYIDPPAKAIILCVDEKPSPPWNERKAI